MDLVKKCSGTPHVLLNLNVSDFIVRYFKRPRHIITRPRRSFDLVRVVDHQRLELARPNDVGHRDERRRRRTTQRIRRQSEGRRLEERTRRVLFDGVG